jgi:hypothetical protein
MCGGKKRRRRIGKAKEKKKRVEFNKEPPRAGV